MYRVFLFQQRHLPYLGDNNFIVLKTHTKGVGALNIFYNCQSSEIYWRCLFLLICEGVIYTLRVCLFFFFLLTNDDNKCIPKHIHTCRVFVFTKDTIYQSIKMYSSTRKTYMRKYTVYERTCVLCRDYYVRVYCVYICAHVPNNLYTCTLVQFIYTCTFSLLRNAF